MVKADFCEECWEECSVITKKEIDHEPYGERRVQRISYTYTSDCCDSSTCSYDLLDMADIAGDSVAMNKPKVQTHESEQCSIEFEISDIEQAAFIYVYGKDRFTIKPMKVANDPTDMQRANWIIYCWAESTAEEYANYNSEHYTTFECRVEDNTVKLWWRL